MSSLLKFELSRMIKSKPLYISVLIGFGLCLWLLVIEMREAGATEEILGLYGTEKFGLYYPRSLYNSFIGLEYAYLPSSVMYAVFPVLAVLPFSSSYYFDKKSGYLKNVLTRCRKSEYYTAKYISAFAGGAIVVFLVLGFSFILSAMFFPALPPELTTDSFSPQTSGQMWTRLFTENPMAYTLLYCIIDIVFYALIATIPLSLSLWVQSSLTVLIAPMLIYTAAHYILTVLGLDSFSPMSFLRPCQIFTAADFTVIIIEAVLIFMLTAFSFFYIGGKQDVL